MRHCPKTGERVTDVSDDGQGCSISQAATSVLADLAMRDVVGPELGRLHRLTPTFHTDLG